MQEKDVEKYLISSIEKRGGLCWKFTSPSRRGVPDRWCVYKHQQFFAELKRPGHKHRQDESFQKAVHRQLASRGVKVYVLEAKQDIDLLMQYLDVGILPEVEHFGKL